MYIQYERRGLGSQAFQSASAFNANIGAWNTARVTTLSNVCAASRPGAHRGGMRSAGRRRMRGHGMRLRRRCLRARAHAHVAMRITVYVDGSPLDTHLCSSAIELPLHPRLSMSNAHTHRPFPRCRYTHNRMHASIVCARASVCAWVCACVSVYGGALHACKLREAIDISGEVLYGCVTM
jgi:hypothetical protein